MKIAEKLKNKKLDVQYEAGAHYQMTYLSDQELKWEALGELAEGEAPEGIEPYYAYEIEEDVYNINWIEGDGMTASQIVDFKTNKVYAFLTWADETIRGGRGHILQQGTFKVVE